MKKVCVVEDESVVRDIFKRLFRQKDIELVFFERGDDAVLALQNGEEYDTIVTDMMLPGKSGLQVLNTAKSLHNSIPVIVMTAFASIDSAVDAMKGGAFDYITKPFNNDEVLLTVEKALQQRSLVKENIHLKRALEDRYNFDNVIGQSQPMHDVFNKVRSAAPSNVHILFCGEHGTGKELMARALHFNSLRKMNPFITVNHTETMSENLLEAQLFGHRQENSSHVKGLIERANHGSLFFDEIGSLPVSTQDKLLHILKNGEFTPPGSNSSIHIGIRIIAATSRDLENAVHHGTFREELFSIINVIEITLPPLRERQEDIPLLTQFFIKKFQELHSKKITEIDREFMDILEQYSFPGNVGELEHIIERAVILTRDLSLKKTDLPDKVLHRRELKTFKLYTDRSFSQQTLDFERELLLYALDQCNGVQKKAAELLGMKPTTLHEKLKRHKLR